MDRQCATNFWLPVHKIIQITLEWTLETMQRSGAFKETAKSLNIS